MTTKQQIFDSFYERALVTRSGGGTAKMKMTRKNATLSEQEQILKLILIKIKIY